MKNKDKDKATNYDKLMGMSIYDLAAYLNNLFPDQCPPGYKAEYTCATPCEWCWYDWLEANATEV